MPIERDTTFTRPCQARAGLSDIQYLILACAVQVVHRDLKSPNILLARDGTAKLADVGYNHMLFTLSQLAQLPMHINIFDAILGIMNVLS